MQNATHFMQALEEPGSNHHRMHYLYLCLVLIIGTFALFKLSYTKQMQFEALMLIIMSYILWGIYHHTAEQSLTWEILLEFIALGSFVFLVLSVVLFLV